MQTYKFNKKNLRIFVFQLTCIHKQHSKISAPLNCIFFMNKQKKP
jgi:hypothetical protein